MNKYTRDLLIIQYIFLLFLFKFFYVQNLKIKKPDIVWLFYDRSINLYFVLSTACTNRFGFPTEYKCNSCIARVHAV